MRNRTVFSILCLIFCQVYGFLCDTDLRNYVLIPSRVIYLGEVSYDRHVQQGGWGGMVIRSGRGVFLPSNE